MLPKNPHNIVTPLLIYSTSIPDSPFLDSQEALSFFNSQVEQSRALVVPFSRGADVSDGWEELIRLDYNVNTREKVGRPLFTKTRRKGIAKY